MDLSVSTSRNYRIPRGVLGEMLPMATTGQRGG